MSVKGVFFDLDGTLIDSRGDLAAAVNHVRKNNGLAELPLETVASHAGNGLTKLIERCFPEMAVTPEIESGVRDYYSANEVVNTVLYPGVREGLAQLSAAGLTLAVVTNKATGNTVNILQKLGVAEFFTEIFGAGGAFALKPSPEGIEHLLKKYDFSSGDCWMLGDHYTDMAAARQAGVWRALAGWGFGSLNGEGFDRSFVNFADFTEFILSNRATS